MNLTFRNASQPKQPFCSGAQAGCRAAELCHLGECDSRPARLRSVIRGDCLSRQGHSNRRFLAIRRGLVASCAIMPDGRRQILYLSAPGDVICSMASEGAESWHEALTPTELCEFDYETLSGLVQRSPTLSNLVFAVKVEESRIDLSVGAIFKRVEDATGRSSAANVSNTEDTPIDFIAGYEPYLALAVVLLLFAAFLSERFDPDVTAAGAAALFIVFGFVPANEVLAAFSNPAPITIAAMFVISGALVRTGLLDALANRVVAAASKSPLAGTAAFLLASLVASALMNNTPVVIVLIPVAIRLAHSLDFTATRLLIPLSYMAVLGGTCTLIGTSTNLLVDGVSQASGMEPFSIFEITPVGLVAAATGGVALLFLGPFLLPDRKDLAEQGGDDEATFLTELRPREDYPGIGRSLDEIAALSRRGIEIVGIRARSGVKREGLSEHVLELGDRIIAKVTTSELLTLRRLEGIDVGLRQGPAPEITSDLIVAEAIVTLSRRSRGVRIAQLAMGHRFGMRVLGAHRHGELLGPDLSTAVLRPADMLLLEGTPESFARMTEEGDLAAITGAGGRAFRRGKAPLALIALFAVVALAAAGTAEISVLALVAVAAILVLRCIDNNEAWASIDAGILVLIFSMLIVGTGLKNSGAVSLIVESLMPVLEGLPPIVTLAAIYLLSSVLTEVVTNNAVAVVVTPLAIGLAEQLGVDPRPFVVAVMFGASASFATPVGYQTNALVYGAGNYRFSDFLRIGIPMNLVVGAAVIGTIPILFPF